MSVKAGLRANSYIRIFKVIPAMIVAVSGMLLLPSPSAYAGTGDNYPSQWRSPVAQDSVTDSWHYYNRECTSWVAWALHDRNGFEMPYAIGSAGSWGSWAQSHGYTVNTTPAVGAVAWWGYGAIDDGYTDMSGHIAWVSSINGSTASIEEYNYGGNGLYHTRNVTRAASQQVQYIHFADIVSTPPAPKKSDLTWIEPSTTAGQSNVYMIPSNGTGWGSTWTAGGWNSPTHVVAGDFTGDGKSDIAWVQPSGTTGQSNVYMIPSTGSGWGSAWTVQTWDTPTNVISGDFNGDGRADLAWVEPSTTPGQSNLYVIPSTGSGWGAAWSVQTWGTPSRVVAGDFTGDGKTDLAWIQPSATSGQSDVYVIPSTGSAWGAAWSVPTWNNPTNVVAGDFNGDGKSDLTWVEPSGTAGLSTISTIPSTGSGWGAAWVASGWNNPTNVVAGDFNGDGKSDLTWVEPSGTPGHSNVYMIPSTGSGWGTAWNAGGWDTPTNVISGDFNGN